MTAPTAMQIPGFRGDLITGHNVAGTAVCDDGIVIDISAMRAVSVDLIDSTALVQGGALPNTTPKTCSGTTRTSRPPPRRSERSPHRLVSRPRDATVLRRRRGGVASVGGVV
jgi:hypothetical protein